MPSETTTAYVRLLVLFRIRRGTFPYGVEDDASTISLPPTTHYTNACVKLTIVTHLSFSERIAIANPSYDNISIGDGSVVPKQNTGRIVIQGIKAALYTIVPRSPFFAFCTPKYCRLQKCG